jgi:undecaprenol kinase
MDQIIRLLRSFKYAFSGLHSATQTETNWKLGIIEAIIVILAGIYFQISKLDWILVILIIGIVLSAELCNSAIEAIVDSFVDRDHPKAKIAKDFAAAQSVIIIIAGGIAGILIFWPYIEKLLR